MRFKPRYRREKLHHPECFVALYPNEKHVKCVCANLDAGLEFDPKYKVTKKKKKKRV